MPEKSKTRIEMIEKLQALLPTLSHDEKEIARYKMEQLCEENPFFHEESRAPRTLLECWEYQGPSRIGPLEDHLRIEKDLLAGYKVIQRAEDTSETRTRIEYAQRKIYFIRSEINKIKRFIRDAGVKVHMVGSENSIVIRKKDKPVSKRSGTAKMTIVSLENKNPAYKNLSLSIYVDDAHILGLSPNDLSQKKHIVISFYHAQHIELLIESNNGVVVGWILLSIEDLTEIESWGTRTLYYSIEDTSTIKISFGECILEKKELCRTKVTLITKRAFGHIMRYIEDMKYYCCGVCHNLKRTDSPFYRCDACRFICHLECMRLIFFQCIEYLKQQEEEEKKREVEEKIAKLREERLKMIVAAIDIREKPESTEEAAYRTQKPEKIGQAYEEEEEELQATKRYSVEHTFEKKKILSISWCNHCGEKLPILSVAVECEVCKNQYHLDCRKLLFKSCGITEELLKGLVQCVPKKSIKKEQKISLDEFNIISVIGKGTFGKVFMCTWKGEKVALKCINKKNVIEKNEEEFIEIERKCLEIAKGSKNPFLIEMLGCFQTNGYVFFVMELAAGGDLYYHRKKREISPEEIKMILAQVLLGLDSLHSNNIIYRDLKLENILFTDKGYIKIADYGLCSIGARNGVAHTVCGTLDFIAPEVIDGEYTQTADWWSFGVVAYELVMNKAPFPGDTDRAIREAIRNDPPEDIDKIEGNIRGLIEGLLTKSPKKRLGAISSQQIKQHPYFESINWSKLKKQIMLPIWSSEQEEVGFDPMLANENPILTPVEELSPEQDTYFQGFD